MASFDGAILPGKVGKVTAQMKTESYRGPVEKTISVSSSDPERPSLTLRLKANVVGSVEILPRDKVWFPSPPKMEYATKILVRKDKTETGTLAIADLQPTAPWLKVKTRKVENPEPEAEGFPAALPGDWIIDVEVSDDAPWGQNSAQQLTFKTGLTREPSITLHVGVGLQRSMMVSPGSIAVDLPAGGEEGTGTFDVLLRPGLKEPIKASASPATFSVTLEPDGPRHYKGRINWKATKESQERSGVLTLSVGTETQNLPVRALLPANRAQAVIPGQAPAPPPGATAAPPTLVGTPPPPAAGTPPPGSGAPPTAGSTTPKTPPPSDGKP